MDEEEKSLITTSKFKVLGEKFDAGKIEVIEVTASETEVQQPTDVTVKFELAHHIAVSSIIKFQFPEDITIPEPEDGLKVIGMDAATQWYFDF